MPIKKGFHSSSSAPRIRRRSFPGVQRGASEARSSSAERSSPSLSLAAPCIDQRRIISVVTQPPFPASHPTNTSWGVQPLPRWRGQHDAVIVYAIVDDALSPGFPLGDAIETFVRREDAERFIEEVRGDDPETREQAQGQGARAKGDHSRRSWPRRQPSGLKCVSRS
jgi:hypothetical protein